ncbi:hypothetical protein K503DRAFT_804861 [Rhizopogon vinicolor AM-OR11-026]|uniref:F-box domain-containing protein n=1 Tax=Rhizopogon vinicolor AM-OR11-026 TaxID=1314800 RepID=A0A1B7MJT4_9AGAM|nr:hypothetical protein K503DRAFT_804861 [Rhizopogon vinicolor AM-OR11-026]
MLTAFITPLQVIRRPVTMEDWSVFERYASRVRVLGDSDLFGSVDVEFVHAMMAFSSKSLLVPNLRAIYFLGICTPAFHPCIRYLLGPDLIYFHLGWSAEDFWSNIICSLLSGLGKHSPQLKVVRLYGAPPQVAELALRGLPHLQEVYLIADKAFRFRTSTLDILRIQSSTLTSTRNVVEQWFAPCKQLHLLSTTAETAPVIERALCELNIVLRTFTPLMPFSSLKIVDLAAFCTSLVDDNALGSIVKSWPRLEELYLGIRFFSRITPRVTFQGLLTVLSSCLNLREFGLAFDATTPDLPTAEKPGGWVCNTNITTLHVGFSPIEQPPQVAVVLSAVLPCLAEINVERHITISRDRDAREAKWAEVLKYISFSNLKEARGFVCLKP